MTKEFDINEFTSTNKKLKDSQYKLKSINLPGANTDNGIVSIGGVKIDTTKSTAFILGWVAGMQYQPDFAGACFYTVTDTVNSLNYFETDWQNLINYYQWYNLFVTDVIHFYSNLVAVYE
jgi:hypothetical protein